MSRIFLSRNWANRLCKFDHARHFQFEWGGKGVGDGQFNIAREEVIISIEIHGRQLTSQSKT